MRVGVSVQGGGRSAIAEGVDDLGAAGTGRRSLVSDWWGGDRPGGLTSAVAEPGGEYTGRLAFLNRLGLRRGYQTVTTIDEGGSVFGRFETAAHEKIHSVIGEHLPSVWKAGDRVAGGVPVGAPVKYFEEVLAYGGGRLAAGRVHLAPAAFKEAFGSLSPVEAAYVKLWMQTTAKRAGQGAALTGFALYAGDSRREGE